MTVVEWKDLGHAILPYGPVNASIGVFDGLHRGHRALLAQLRVQDNPIYPDARSMVVTFRTSPKKVLQPNYPGDLMTWTAKLATLEALGVDLVVAIDFSEEFSKMTGRDFFFLLKKSFVFSKLVLGWNFSFGRGSGTTASDLGWLADPQTRLTVVPPLVADGGAVSSSRIRTALLQGNIALANHLLGREYTLTVDRDPASFGRVNRLDAREWPVMIPGSGTYTVLMDDRWTTLHVKESILTWESPPGERIKHMVFVQGVQNGIE